MVTGPSSEDLFHIFFEHGLFPLCLAENPPGALFPENYRPLENMIPDGFRRFRACFRVAFSIWKGGAQVSTSGTFIEYEFWDIYKKNHFKIHVFIKNSRHMIYTNIPVAFPHSVWCPASMVLVLSRSVTFLSPTSGVQIWPGSICRRKSLDVSPADFFWKLTISDETQRDGST